MTPRSIILSAALATAVLAAVPARAAVVFSGRSIVATVNTTRADFADAYLTVDATTFVAAGSSGTRTLDFQPLPGFAGGTYTTSGNVTLSDFTADPSGATGRVTATGAGSFSFRNVYTTGVDDPYADATLIRYTNGSTALPPFADQRLPLIELYLGVGGGGLVDPGGTFSFTLIVPGNYSTTAGLASGPGQFYEDASAFPGFTVQQDYVYDPRANTTIFSLLNNAFQSGQFVGLDTYFVGRSVAGVPEPATWGLMLVGFGALGLALRRRRHAVRFA